jgi:threonine/homoserine/homoserine lactone efflux protein
VHGTRLEIRLLRSTGDDPITGAAAASGHRTFVQGLLVDLSNLKAAVFFTTLFASRLAETLTVPLAGLVLAAVALVVYGWH